MYTGRGEGGKVGTGGGGIEGGRGAGVDGVFKPKDNNTANNPQQNFLRATKQTHQPTNAAWQVSGQCTYGRQHSDTRLPLRPAQGST